MTSIPLMDLSKIFGSKLHENVTMANFTTAQVGGPVPALISIQSLDDLVAAAEYLWNRSIPFIILGSVYSRQSLQ